MKIIKLKTYILIATTLMLIFFTVSYFKIFNNNAYLVSVPFENTPLADFEVVFGQFKLEWNKSTNAKEISTTDIWVENKEKYFEIRPKDETTWQAYYYVVEGKFIKSFSNGGNEYPVILISKINRIHIVLFWSINLATLICLFLSLKFFVKKASANTGIVIKP